MLTLLSIFPHVCWFVALALIMRGTDRRVDELKHRLSRLETKADLEAPVVLPELPADETPRAALERLREQGVSFERLAAESRAMLLGGPGYRERADRDAPNVLAPLCGTYVVQMSSIDKDRVAFHSSKLKEGITFSFWALDKLSPAQRSDVASALDTGTLKITVEIT